MIVIYWGITLFLAILEYALRGVSISKLGKLLKKKEKNIEFPAEYYHGIIYFITFFKVVFLAIGSFLLFQELGYKGLLIFIVLVFVGDTILYQLCDIFAEHIVSYFINIISFVFKIFKFPISWLQNIYENLAEIELKEEEYKEEELISLVDDKNIEGMLPYKEKEMIKGILEFRDIEVREIMTPRTEIKALEQHTLVEEAKKMAIECGHSRIPVFDKEIDNIIGILYVKDMLGVYNKNLEVKDLVRKAYFIPESKRIADLLEDLKRQKVHIAIVLDEYGGTAGLVTIEDIIEEIVGEIEDEHDKRRKLPDIIPLAPGTFDVNARIRIDELNEKLSLGLEENESYDTLAGYLIYHFDHIPQKGEKIYIDNTLFVIVDGDARRINRVRIKKGSE